MAGGDEVHPQVIDDGARETGPVFVKLLLDKNNNWPHNRLYNVTSL